LVEKIPGEENRLGYLSVYRGGGDNVKMNLFEKWGVKGWDGLSVRRIGSSGGYLWTRLWTFGVHRCLEVLYQLNDYQLNVDENHVPGSEFN